MSVCRLRQCTKIVLISGDDTVRQEALDSGATIFLKKPTEVKVITETITTMINNLFNNNQAIKGIIIRACGNKSSIKNEEIPEMSMTGKIRST